MTVTMYLATNRTDSGELLSSKPTLTRVLICASTSPPPRGSSGAAAASSAAFSDPGEEDVARRPEVVFVLLSPGAAVTNSEWTSTRRSRGTCTTVQIAQGEEEEGRGKEKSTRG